MSVVAAAAAILLFSLPSSWAGRSEQGSSSQASSGSHAESLLAAASAAGMSAAELYDAVHDHGVHRNLDECKESQERVAAKESVEKMESCINAIASFAKDTQSQRAKSLKANKNYADDLVLAKKLLKYLVKQTDTQEHVFRAYQDSEKQHRTDIEGILSQRPENAHNGPLLARDFYRPGSSAAMLQTSSAGPGSLMSMYTEASPMGYQAASGPAFAMAPPPWANMAAMYTARGQGFAVPQPSASEIGLVGRRPSQLQVDSSTASSIGSLQARLDSEAERLEENDAGDLQG